jgi:hypothetical protein
MSLLLFFGLDFRFPPSREVLCSSLRRDGIVVIVTLTVGRVILNIVDRSFLRGSILAWTSTALR